MKCPRIFAQFCAVTAFICVGALTVARPQDLVTAPATAALNAEWADPNGSELAIRALEAYGKAKNVEAALAVLKSGQVAPTDPDLYDIAATSFGEKFWRMVAGAHTGAASCDAVGPILNQQFSGDKKSLSKTAQTYRDSGDYAALAILLRYTPAVPAAGANPALTVFQARAIYRGCFSISPSVLFLRVEESLGIKK